MQQSSVAAPRDTFSWRFAAYVVVVAVVAVLYNTTSMANAIASARAGTIIGLAGVPIVFGVSIGWFTWRGRDMALAAAAMSVLCLVAWGFNSVFG